MLPSGDLDQERDQIWQSGSHRWVLVQVNIKYLRKQLRDLSIVWEELITKSQNMDPLLQAQELTNQLKEVMKLV